MDLLPYFIGIGRLRIYLTCICKVIFVKDTGFYKILKSNQYLQRNSKRQLYFILAYSV